MTTPEQKHQKSKTMKDLYQKPEMRFIEMPTTSPPYVLRAVVGDGSVGNARMEIVEGGEWRVVARYRDHAGDWDALEGCADYDDAREWAERWFQARWDETWKTLCGDGWQSVGVDLPEMGVPVWLYQPGRGIWIGGRGEVNAEEGWLWGNSHCQDRCNHNQIPKQTPPVSFEEEKDDCFRVNATVGSVWIGTFNVAEKNGRFIMSAEYHNSEGMGSGGGDYYSMDVATEAGKDWIKLQWGRTWQQYLKEPTA